MKSLDSKTPNQDWHPNIWPPFTQINNSKPQIEVTHGKEALLFTKDPEKELIDAISSWWVTLHGHSNEYISDAIFDQAKKLEQVIFADFLHPQAKKLAERLSELTKLERLFFSDNGSTAVEVALKIAFQSWQNSGETRTQIVAFDGAYHGDTFGAMALGERNIFNENFDNLMFPVRRVPWPSTWMNDEEVENKENKNSLLIADEVLTGFGRCGSLFAFQKAKIIPDLISISKGLTGGFLPMGITLCKEKIFQSFIDDSPRKTFWHGHSFTANPLGCAAANASLDLLEKEPYKYLSFEEKHLSHLNKFKNLPYIKKIRVSGTIAAFDLDIGNKTGYFNNIGKEIKSLAMEQGLFIRPLGNVIYLLPPLCITDNQLEKSYWIIRQILDNL
jgi:adenosylmethionine-8-amino-7-oxononanoate aminotransferase